MIRYISLDTLRYRALRSNNFKEFDVTNRDIASAASCLKRELCGPGDELHLVLYTEDKIRDTKLKVLFNLEEICSQEISIYLMSAVAVSDRVTVQCSETWETLAVLKDRNSTLAGSWSLPTKRKAVKISV